MDSDSDNKKNFFLRALLTLGGVVVAALLIIGLVFLVTPRGTVRGFSLFFAGAIGVALLAATRKSPITKFVVLVAGAILLVLVFGFYMSGGFMF